MQMLIGIIFVIFLNILTAMDKSEIRKMYNGDFICKKKEIEHNGIIPLIYKRIICVLWKGHNYIPVSPEIEGKRLFECKYCKKQRVW